MLIRFRLRDAQHGGYSPAQLGIYLVNEFAWVLRSPYCCEIPARTLWEQRHRVLPDFARYVGGACHSAPEPRGWIRAAPGICHVRTRHQHPMVAPERGHTALLGAVRPGGGGGGAAGAGQSRRQGAASPFAAVSPQQGGSRYSSRDVTPGWVSLSPRTAQTPAPPPRKWNQAEWGTRWGWALQIKRAESGSSSAGASRASVPESGNQAQFKAHLGGVNRAGWGHGSPHWVLPAVGVDSR